MLLKQIATRRKKTRNAHKVCVVGDKLIRFPVHCLTFGKEWTSALTRDELTDALDSGSAIRVYAECHDAPPRLSATIFACL
jgi:hypothetical protein